VEQRHFAIIAAVTRRFSCASQRPFLAKPDAAAAYDRACGDGGRGGFAILTLFLPVGENWIIYLRTMLYGSIAVNLIVIAAELMTTHPTADAKATVQIIVSGVFSAHFWLGTVILGNVLPLLLMWLGGAPELALAGVAVLAGIYITEHIWVRAPQLIPLS
jgi:hypothetical protein